MTKCSIDDCPLDTYEDDNKCILHCEKGGYDADFKRKRFLYRFYEELIEYIIRFVFEYHETVDINKMTFRNYLRDQENDRNSDVATFAKARIVVLTGIAFPGRDSRDSFDYLKVLRKVGRLHFQSCTFDITILELESTECLYVRCNFCQPWDIYNSPVLPNRTDVLYKRCSFNEDVSCCSGSDRIYVIDSSLFENCEFKKRVYFHDAEFNEPIFRNSDDFLPRIDEVRLTNCYLNQRFILNNSNINQFICENTCFNDKFEIKKTHVKRFEVFNTNYKKLVDTHGTTFIKFSINRSIFEDFVGFEECKFGIVDEIGSDYVATFTYATFHNFVNFRDTTFSSGLDIAKINLKGFANFLNTTIDPINTNRETYRIIKDSFDKIGNKIEGNKMFSAEMKKYKEELKGSGRIQDKIILFLNEKMSDFGQSYFRPLIGILFAGAVYTFLVYAYEHHLLHGICQPDYKIIKNVFHILNMFAQNILPFRNVLKDGMECISLVFYIIFAVLIWQTIVAVKRHTKR